jgi:hypothetical protein
MTDVPATPRAVGAVVALYKSGPGLIDLLVDVAELRISVTGPRMLFERLELLTTLSAFDGCTVLRLRDLAASLEGTVHCGLVGIERATIEVATLRSGGVLRIGVGPPSMYQSDLILRTRTGETFRALVTRLLSTDPERSFFAGLHGVPATGHLEHHGVGVPDGGGHDGDDGGHDGHDHGHDHGHDAGGGDGHP